MKILLIDDDANLREAVTIALELQWPEAEVLTATSGETGLDVFFEHEPNIILLDLTMPGIGGFEVLRQVRRISNVPVILLTARGEEADKVRGLELGANDYVTKPFSHLELLARIRAVLRRTEVRPAPSGQSEFRFGDLSVDFDSREVTKRGQAVHLTPTEMNLLYQLVRNAGRALPHQLLLTKVWGEAYTQDTEYLKVYVNRLRQKIEDDSSHPRYLLTERGIGYRFVRPEAGATVTEGAIHPG